MAIARFAPIRKIPSTISRYHSTSREGEDAEFDQLISTANALTSSEVAKELMKAGVDVSAVYERAELNRQYAYLMRARQRAASPSSRFVAYKLQDEVDALKDFDHEELLQLCSENGVLAPPSALTHELRVLLGRKRLEDDVAADTTVDGDDDNTDDSEEYLTKTMDSAKRGFKSGVNYVRNLTDALSQSNSETVRNESHLIGQHNEKNRRVASTLGDLNDMDEDSIDYAAVLREVESLNSFDAIVTWCADKKRSLILRLLKTKDIRVPAYITFSKAVTTLADEIMSTKTMAKYTDQINAGASPTHYSTIGVSNFKPSRDIDTFTVEKDLWHSIVQEGMPNVFVSVANALGDGINRLVGSLTGAVKVNIKEGKHPFTVVESGILLLGGLSSSIVVFLADWAASQRLSSSSVAAISLGYALWTRRGPFSILKSLLVIKFITTLMNTLGVPLTKGAPATLKGRNTSHSTSVRPSAATEKEKPISSRTYTADDDELGDIPFPNFDIPI